MSQRKLTQQRRKGTTQSLIDDSRFSSFYRVLSWKINNHRVQEKQKYLIVYIEDIHLRGLKLTITQKVNFIQDPAKVIFDFFFFFSIFKV